MILYHGPCHIDHHLAIDSLKIHPPHSAIARHYPWNSKPTFSRHLKHGIPCERCAFLGGRSIGKFCADAGDFGICRQFSWIFSVKDLNIPNQKKLIRDVNRCDIDIL